MPDDDLAVFYRRYNECCNQHRVEGLGEFVARDVAINGTAGGIDSYTEALAVVVRAFPDFRWELRHLVVEAPWVAAHLADTGTHRDTFFGVEATGRRVHAREFAVYRIDHGRISEVWGTAFHEDLLRQLG